MRPESLHGSHDNAAHSVFVGMIKLALTFLLTGLGQMLRSWPRLTSTREGAATLAASRMPQSVSEHLARARSLLAKRDVWTQDAYARDVAGRIVDSQSAGAVRFCCSGALYTTEHPQHGSRAARAIVSRVIGDDLEVWNDAPGREHKDVIDAFDHAISLARSEEAGALSS